MKYLCLICTEVALEEMSDADAATTRREYAEFTADIIRSGHYLAANRLRPIETATTIRVRNGKVQMTDGPFAETKEHLGGFYLIEARDLNEAIQIASRIPSARQGCIELRPVAEEAPAPAAAP